MDHERHEEPTRRVVGAGLADAMASGEPVEVVVLFRSVPSATELATLGLHSRGTARELGFGVLSPDAIRELIQRQDVASVDLAPADTPRVAAELPANVDPELAAGVTAEPGKRQRVAVYFTDQPSADVLADLALAGTGANPAVGMLDAAGVRRVAARADVSRVAIMPEPHAF